jgi:mannose-6-phosphate isomerase-like protein (cupin superfamily)
MMRNDTLPKGAAVKISFTESMAKLPLPATEKWPQGLWDFEALRSGDVSLLFFAPRFRDYQAAHSQDELYIIVRGSGLFQLEGQEIRFGPGDVLYVPAGKIHRFTQFTDELATWVVFFGPHTMVSQPAA